MILSPAIAGGSPPAMDFGCGREVFADKPERACLAGIAAAAGCEGGCC